MVMEKRGSNGEGKEKEQCCREGEVVSSVNVK